MSYTVKAINGRMPTTLRITACPNPDNKDITDELWETFDVMCFLEESEDDAVLADYNLFRTADWKLGAYFGNEVHGGQNRRYAVFPCEVNDTFSFDFTGTEYGLWVYYYDENGELSDFGYTTVTSDTEIKITEKNGKAPTELRISVYPVAGGDITEEMWESFDVVCTRSSNYIKVATMNYGLWNDGVTKYVENSRVESVLAAWKDMLDDQDVDILAGQEWLRYFDRDNTMTAEDSLFAYKYRYQYSTSTGNGKNLVSKTECYDYAVYTFSNGSGREYIKTYTEINGKTVCLINAHCSLETDFTVNRKAEFEELIRIMDQEEYVILFGDFNAYTVSEFGLFTEAGYSVVNGGALGTFDTWSNFDKASYWENKAIDNIIVSPTIRILDAEVDRRDLSDHSMLSASLRLLEEDEFETSDLSEEPQSLSVNYSEATASGTVYSVDVIWDNNDFTFDYAAGSTGRWDAENHEFKDTVAGGWEDDDLSVTVTNRSNAALEVSVSVSDADEADGLTVTSDKAGETLATAENTAVENAPKTVFTLTVDGIPSQSAVKIATATISFRASA